ncbi:MAG: hypothetical protein ACFFA3_17335 [Promethearchaeota archaeon]
MSRFDENLVKKDKSQKMEASIDQIVGSVIFDPMQMISDIRTEFQQKFSAITVISTQRGGAIDYNIYNTFNTYKKLLDIDMISLEKSLSIYFNKKVEIENRFNRPFELIIETIKDILPNEIIIDNTIRQFLESEIFKAPLTSSIEKLALSVLSPSSQIELLFQLEYKLMRSRQFEVELKEQIKSLIRYYIFEQKFASIELGVYEFILLWNIAHSYADKNGIASTKLEDLHPNYEYNHFIWGEPYSKKDLGFFKNVLSGAEFANIREELMRYDNYYYADPPDKAGGYTLAYRSVGMKRIYFEELFIEQMGTELDTGESLLDGNLELHHLPYLRKLWLTKYLVAMNPGHDLRVPGTIPILTKKHHDYFFKTWETKRIIKKIVDGSLDPTNSLPKHWNEKQKESFINKLNYYKKYGKWTFLNHFYPQLMKEYFPLRYNSYTPSVI